ncbi:CaiB/BaiF CoA transferase family protein [Variovorax guangxiensis]|uniref:CoA transferase n=1 Tax=Variovorax guangxiensis TaxID=1775474 RepID=A0A502DR24_9BURK|nr:CaiB/BaiF CoA-transferase family protein [Variovorax guangxiensis]RZI68629.1 MAG: CoA transferase [Variovorax sp.]TPG23311.1 CoA transferase [Variovorax ginsengisoli]TPG27858.1 CoA transferase [Variovorax guangxiensis]
MASHISDSDLPLSRYKVLDLTIARAGPVAVRLLADWGADVTRVEATVDRGSVTGRRRGADEQNLHRNKRSLCLDLKSPQGAEVLRRLIAQSDVVVENFRSAVKERLGLTYAQLKTINPRIILASISGFGQDGPYSDRPGVDQIVQGMCGLSSVTGEPGRGPVRVGIAISDTTAGMFLGQGILLALLHREHTGEGQWVHTSLIESMLNKLDFQAARYTVDGEVAQQQGNSHPTVVPMGTYRSRDGLVNIAASTSRMWEGFCEALGASALRANAAYRDAASRLANRVALDADIDRVTAQFDTADLVARLNPAGVPCGPIYDIGQAFEDPQVQHLRMTRPAAHPAMGEIALVRSAINLSACPHPERFHHAGPDPGEQSDALLRELGYDDPAIARLRGEGAVA